MCSCKSCGFVTANVTANGLAYQAGQACAGGCGLPQTAEFPYLRIQVTNRVNQPGQWPMPGMPLMNDDFDPTKRIAITVSCVPLDANCLVQNRQ